MGDDAEKVIAGLLARHTREDVGSYISCLCGWRHVGPYPTGARPYIAHLASVIAAHMAASDELTALREKESLSMRTLQRMRKERDEARRELTEWRVGGTATFNADEEAERERATWLADHERLRAERDALRERIKALADAAELITEDPGMNGHPGYKALRALLGDA